ncbi:cytochrome c oxidase subunit 2A [Virgibacillus xinjiangensis]|uniref:Cytochrome c oxidase subunit 2A n=1 Tax=Virgibacillus xinjiangensis TaxID=393090 RepID=A0ABV7CXX2_9BACI
MKAEKKVVRHTASEEKNPSLKGTLISVSAVGLFILISWVGAFMLFLGR